MDPSALALTTTTPNTRALIADARSTRLFPESKTTTDSSDSPSSTADHLLSDWQVMVSGEDGEESRIVSLEAWEELLAARPPPSDTSETQHDSSSDHDWVIISYRDPSEIHGYLVKETATIFQRFICDYVVGAPQGSTNPLFDTLLRNSAEDLTLQLLNDPPAANPKRAPIVLRTLAQLEQFVDDYAAAVTDFRSRGNDNDPVDEAGYVTAMLEMRRASISQHPSDREITEQIGTLLQSLVKGDEEGTSLPHALVGAHLPTPTKAILDKLLSTAFLLTFISPLLLDEDFERPHIQMVDPAEAPSSGTHQEFIDAVNASITRIANTLITLEAPSFPGFASAAPTIAAGVIADINPGKLLHKIVFEPAEPERPLKGLVLLSHLLWNRRDERWTRRFTAWPAEDAALAGKIAATHEILSTKIRHAVKPHIPKMLRRLALCKGSPVTTFLKNISERAFRMLCHGEEQWAILVYRYLLPTVQES